MSFHILLVLFLEHNLLVGHDFLLHNPRVITRPSGHRRNQGASTIIQKIDMYYQGLALVFMMTMPSMRCCSESLNLRSPWPSELSFPLKYAQCNYHKKDMIEIGGIPSRESHDNKSSRN